MRGIGSKDCDWKTILNGRFFGNWYCHHHKNYGSNHFLQITFEHQSYCEQKTEAKTLSPSVPALPSFRGQKIDGKNFKPFCLITWRFKDDLVPLGNRTVLSFFHDSRPSTVSITKVMVKENEGTRKTKEITQNSSLSKAFVLKSIVFQQSAFLICLFYLKKTKRIINGYQNPRQIFIWSDETQFSSTCILVIHE